MAASPFDLGLLGGHRGLDLLIDEVIGAGEAAIYGGGAIASNGLVHQALVELLR